MHSLAEIRLHCKLAGSQIVTDFVKIQQGGKMVVEKKGGIGRLKLSSCQATSDNLKPTKVT